MALSSAARSATSGSRGAILHQRVALGEHGGHQQVFCSGDSDLVEDDMRAAQAVRARLKVAMLLLDDPRPSFPGL